MQYKRVATICVAGLSLLPIVSHSQPETPKRGATSPVKKLEASYEDMSLTAKIYQNDDDTWKYYISGGAPNGCYSLLSKYNSQKNNIIAELTVPSENEMCTMALKELESSGIISTNNLNNLQLEIETVNEKTRKDSKRNDNRNRMDALIQQVIDRIKHTIKKIMR